MIAGIVACDPLGTDDTTTTESTTTTTETTTTIEPTTSTTEAPTTTTTTLPPPVEELDPSGNTIPDSDYPIPSGAVFMAPDGNDSNPGTKTEPVKSIRRAVDLTPAGGTIVLRGGAHRTWYSNPEGTALAGINKSLTIQGYPHEQAWFDGADVVTDWQGEANGIWSTYWSTPSFCVGQYYSHPPTDPVRGPCQYEDASLDPNWPMAGDPQMAFVDGKPLRQVASLQSVNEDTFFYDWHNRRLYVGNNPADHLLELSARPVALVLGNNQNFTIRGVGFRRYASNQYSNLTGSTVYLGADKATVENVVISYNAGVGLAWANPRNNSTVTNSVFARNGSIGFGPAGQSGTRSGLLVEDNVFSQNNAEHFGANCNVACGQGNIKFARMTDFTVRNNLIEGAPGPQAYGFWCDIDCKDAVIANNTVRDNGASGIFYEISSKGIIAGNLVENNGQKGILVGSATTKVWNNTVRTNQSADPLAQGIAVYDDTRYPPNPGIGPNTTGVEIVNNVVEGPSGGVLFIAHDGPAVNGTQVEDFFNRIDHNAYWHSGSNVVNWKNGNPSIGFYFSTIASFRAATGWDQNSVEQIRGSNPNFTNLAGAALPQDVADAMGVSTGAVNRGAPDSNN